MCIRDRSADEIREYRGTLTEPGKEDPYAKRSVEENLALFEDCLLYTSIFHVMRWQIPVSFRMGAHGRDSA